MGDHIYAELADGYARWSAVSATNALYDRPNVLRLLGPLAGRRVLELGSAAGHLTRELVAGGAEVVGLDKSPRMVEHARRAMGDRARFEVADLAEPQPWLESEGFDLVSASLVLHYLSNWDVVLGEVARVQRPGGALVLSLHHPVTGWLLSDRDDYHRTELVEEQWVVDGVPTAARMWRRPVSGVLTPLLQHGLVVEAVDEPRPDLDAATVPDERTRRALNTQPVFLFVRAGRPA